MLVCMLILVELVAGEMTLSLLLIHSFFFFVVGFLGKDIRCAVFLMFGVVFVIGLSIILI